MPIPQISDTIHLNNPDAGDANAGNGGNGYNHGDIDYNPVAYVSPVQTVDGASTHLHNGDHVWQTADWDAGGGGAGGLSQAQNGFLASLTSGAGGAGGNAQSNGDQGNTSGHDTASVAAATTATQYTQLVADQHANILAGVGGNGGNGNNALGGDISSALVHSNPETTTVNNDMDHFINAFGHIDVSHLGS